MTIRRTAVLATAPLGAAPLAVLALSTPAVADGVGSGRPCSGSTIKLSAEKDDRRIEVEADVDGVRGSDRWRLTLKQNGRTFANVVRRADDDRDIDVDRDRPDTRGKDTFTFTATRLATGNSCTVKVVLR
ncbi:hypothetical protein [Nocardioides sp. R-C-SC26]|uniref:hypothetical protein n=1 Tax=Nocardioides sp. R-C-SC26 TaxID=2870414 RepID=UPI001E2938CD|nr:hypothetical protein [Nocardioides sp. R-C-SC26]